MFNRRNFIIFAKGASVAGVIIIVLYFIMDKPLFLSKDKKIDRLEKTIAVQTNAALQDSIVRYGIRFLDTPYLAAGCGVDGFDCSGFVYFVYQHFDIDVPRSSSGFVHYGDEIAVDQIQKGDLLLFLSPTRDVIGHIGIVVEPKGSKSTFIHASSGKEMKVIISDLSSEGYTRRFVKAVRVI